MSLVQLGSYTLYTQQVGEYLCQQIFIFILQASTPEFITIPGLRRRKQFPLTQPKTEPVGSLRPRKLAAQKQRCARGSIYKAFRKRP